MFEASKKRTSSGDISIDDVILRDGPCNPKPTTVGPSAPPHMLMSKCTFQTGYCGMTQSKADQFDWTRKFGSTTSGRTGPKSDHTTGTSKGNDLHKIFLINCLLLLLIY